VDFKLWDDDDEGSPLDALILKAPYRPGPALGVMVGDLGTCEFVYVTIGFWYYGEHGRQPVDWDHGCVRLTVVQDGGGRRQREVELAYDGSRVAFRRFLRALPPSMLRDDKDPPLDVLDAALKLGYGHGLPRMVGPVFGFDHGAATFAAQSPMPRVIVLTPP
jgi:hypothetical protein